MPPFDTHTDASRHYQSGFANDFATEALPGALPIGRNSPQRAAYGLYASSFPAPRSPRRARTTGARGCIASGRRRFTSRSRG